MLPVERLPWGEASAFAFVYTLVIFALIYNTAFSYARAELPIDETSVEEALGGGQATT